MCLLIIYFDQFKKILLTSWKIVWNLVFSWVFKNFERPQKEIFGKKKNEKWKWEPFWEKQKNNSEFFSQLFKVLWWKQCKNPFCLNRTCWDHLKQICMQFIYNKRNNYLCSNVRIFFIYLIQRYIVFKNV